MSLDNSAAKKRYVVKSLTLLVAVVLIASPLAAISPIIAPAQAQAAPAPALPQLSPQFQQLPREERNWEYLNHNPFGTNYNPQKQITKDNVKYLELKWVFPLPVVRSQGDKVVGCLNLAEGTITPPLVVDGVVYQMTSAKTLIALNAKDGRTIWSTPNVYDANVSITKMPIDNACRNTHGIHYVDGQIWLNDFGCQITFFDAKTGKVARKYENLCSELPLNSPQGFGVPTNSGYYAPAGSHPPQLYRGGNLLIWAMGGASEGTNGGRAFIEALDRDTGKLVWRFFYMPPCGDPATCKPLFAKEKEEWGQWLVSNCNKIWIQRIKACELDQDLLRNDWGKMRFNSGVSNVWGQMVVDEETGILYFGTAQPGPDWNATHAPGFRLFGSSIIALNVKTGEMIWAHQTTARDLWDYDCSWNTIFANARISGQNRKVIIKGCKNGLVHVLDAATGQAYYYLESPDIKRTKDAQFLDPRSKADMTKPWTNYPSKDSFWMNCSAGGCIESDKAYDPSRNMVFAGTYNNPAWAKVGPADLRGVSLASAPAGTRPFVPKVNTTINAWDLNDGSLKWKYFIDGVGFRGAVVVSGGMVWPTGNDAVQRALDADTGKVLYEQQLGAPSTLQPTFGADSDGKIKLFRLISSTTSPGGLMAYGLPDKLPEPQVITKEVIKEVIKEVPKEVIKEVPKEVIKEVPKEVIKTVTVETVSPISYAAVGISVVILVVAGVLFTRRKKA